MARHFKPGDKFGNLTIIEDTGRRNHQNIIWLCRCACGAVVQRTTVQLRNPSKQSCGKKECAVPVPQISVGDSFGMLTVVSLDHITRSHTKYWNCRCVCGTELVVPEGQLIRGRKVSCGNPICITGDLSGQRFGKLMVIEYVGSSRSGSVYRCRCDCGNETEVNATNLRDGSTTSCGCARSEQAKEAVKLWRAQR